MRNPGMGNKFSPEGPRGLTWSNAFEAETGYFAGEERWGVPPRLPSSYGGRRGGR